MTLNSYSPFQCHWLRNPIWVHTHLDEPLTELNIHEHLKHATAIKHDLERTVRDNEFGRLTSTEFYSQQPPQDFRR